MISNAIVQDIEIGIEPDGTPYARVVLVNEAELPESIAWYQRSFSINSDGSSRSSAEIIGQKIYALAWVMDWCRSFNKAEGQIVRVKWETCGTPPKAFITAIGHAIQDRWLSRDGPMQFPYPFYTGIPKLEPDKAA